MLCIPGVEEKACVGVKLLRWLHPNEKLFSRVSGSTVLANTSLTFSGLFLQLSRFCYYYMVPGEYLTIFPRENARLVSTV